MLTLSDESKKVLAALSERASEGFDLAKRTGLRGNVLEAAVKELLQQGLIDVRGEPYGEGLLSSYFWVPPQAQGKAAFYLGNLNAAP